MAPARCVLRYVIVVVNGDTESLGVNTFVSGAGFSKFSGCVGLAFMTPETGSRAGREAV